MKIAFFLGGLKRGGAESLIYDICRKKDEVPFDFCCLYRNEGDYSDAFHETGAELIRVGKTGGMLRYLLDLRKAVLANGIDIVHAQTSSNALVSILALLMSRVKVVTTFHGFSFADAPKWYRKLVYCGSRRVLCVSEFEKRHYERKWGLPEHNKIGVVYNGIDFSKLEGPEPDLSHPVQVSGNTLNMLMVGSFNEVRNQYFVCQVMHRLNQLDVPCRMYFAGRQYEFEPWWYDKCVAFCQENGLMDKVFFMGNRSDIPWLLRQMDLFLYASDHDTFGIAVLEALAAGLPVLVNDWAVMKEITLDGEFAQLYQTGNVDECVAKIRKFAELNGSVRPECTKTMEVVRERYSIEGHIRALNELYRSCGG
jgi:glycosyltransferase involved in cell wall biosynthesis